MTAPRTRLIEGETDFERSLLRSYEGENPSGEVRKKTLALVGMGAALGASSAASTATAAAPAAIGLTKLLAASAIIIAATGVTVSYTLPPSPVAAPSPPSKTSQALVSTSERAPSTPPRSPAPEPTARPVAPIDAPPKPTAPFVPATTQPPGAVVASAPPAAPTPATPPTTGLGEEVAALDRARESLAAGDTAKAIRLVDEYGEHFPNAGLAQEATALRIEALLQQGNRSAANDLANEFLRSHPTSPHAARIRLLLGRGSNP
jgi:hypothetical protein